MTILVDNPDEIEVSLNQQTEAKPEPQNIDSEQQADERAEAPESRIPDKFKGKSPEEIIDMYTNLESQYGRLTNDLGEYRSMTDRFLALEEKRVADLGNAAQEDDFHIDPTELLANPEKILEDFYQRRLANDPNVQGLAERLERIEGHVTQSTLQEKHPDAADIANDQRFRDWVGASGFRTRTIQQAIANKDTEALSYLLDEYKSQPDYGQAQETDTQQSETETARRVSSESSSTGSAVNTAKRFSRRKLVELKMKNPEEYAARSNEILKAYAEGRVDD